MSRGAFSEGFTTRKLEPDGAQCTVWQGARHRIDPTALCGAQGARVARQGMRSRHATLGAQQNPRHCGVPGRTAGGEEARS